jgi:hypothetical protein
MSKLLSVIAGGVLLFGVGAANAAEPIALSDTQMDQVAAGLFNFGSVNYAVVGQVAGSTAAAGNSAVNILTFSAAASSATNNASVVQF